MTFDLEAVEKRHAEEEAYPYLREPSYAKAHEDRGALLAEVHKLREALVLVRMSGAGQLLADETKRIIDAILAAADMVERT